MFLGSVVAAPDGVRYVTNFITSPNAGHVRRITLVQEPPPLLLLALGVAAIVAGQNAGDVVDVRGRF